jgi:membrane-associated phospholipid phosphatase
MKKVFIFFISLFILKKSGAQDSVNLVREDNLKITSINQTGETTSRYPYKTSFKKDAPVIAIAFGLTYLGNNLIKNEKPLTVAELANKTKDKVPFFDRGNAGFYSDKINKDSYIPFLGSFAMPLIMILNKNESRNASYILVMYIESLSITSALFTMAAGTIHRSRPLVYGTIAPTDQRINKNNQRSFFAGHTAATASATFFAAKVFQDINPDSKAKPIVWIVAAAVPAVVGYMRYKSGFHFLSDNLLGYVVGAASGLLIPEWHKSKAHKNLTFVPQIGKDFKGFSFVYSIK